MSVTQDGIPIPCEDRRRCGAAKRWLVDSGSYASAGHSIGNRTCQRHLPDTVAHAARFAQPVRVVAVGAPVDQLAAFFDARGPVPASPREVSA